MQCSLACTRACVVLLRLRLDALTNLPAACWITNIPKPDPFVCVCVCVSGCCGHRGWQKLQLLILNSDPLHPRDSRPYGARVDRGILLSVRLTACFACKKPRNHSQQSPYNAVGNKFPSRTYPLHTQPAEPSIQVLSFRSCHAPGYVLCLHKNVWTRKLNTRMCQIWAASSTP